MKVAFLTSSRADYSIYYPLLKQLQQDPFFDVRVIAFGSHVSQYYGYTLQAIQQDGFKVDATIESLVMGDSPAAIASAMGLTITRFASLWERETYDLVFALGDRYEMFAAVAAAVPFHLPIAHLHGGENTLGAIDEVFRHSMTAMATYHFATTEAYRKRVISIVGHDQNVYNVGALSIDNLRSLKLYTLDQFKNKFGIDLQIPTILITFHPETVSFERNEQYAEELVGALESINDYQLVITMPNADTMGNVIRQKLHAFIEKHPQAIGVESLGTVGYLSCMKYCRMMLGNTSSGFVEASFFPKYVINLGTRQQGRLITPNILNCEIQREAILSCILQVETLPVLPPMEYYGDGHASQKIAAILKNQA